MSFLRNSEIKILIAGLLTIALIGTITGFFIDIRIRFFVIAVVLAMTGYCWFNSDNFNNNDILKQ